MDTTSSVTAASPDAGPSVVSVGPPMGPLVPVGPVGSSETALAPEVSLVPRGDADRGARGAAGRMGRPVTAKMPEKAPPRSRPVVRARGTRCPSRSFHRKMVARSQPVTSGTVSTTNCTASLRLVARDSCSERLSKAWVVTLLCSASARTARMSMAAAA